MLGESTTIVSLRVKLKASRIKLDNVIRQHNRTAQPYSHALAGRQSPSNLSKAPDKPAPAVAALDTSSVKQRKEDRAKRAASRA